MKRTALTFAIVACFSSATSHATFRGSPFPGTIEPIQGEVCINTLFFTGGYTAYGKQYLDPNNGVILDNYTLATRWQGDNLLDNPVSYDMFPYTGLTVTNQRGYQPENGPAATPGVQLNCFDVGFLLNSWWTPHRPIPGGGYNDIWGYAWSTGNMPTPFIKNGAGTHLVLQANAGVNGYFPTFSTRKLPRQVDSSLLDSATS